MSLSWPEMLASYTSAVIVAGIAAAIAIAIHLILFAILSRFVRLSESKGDDELVRRLRHPLRWSMVAIAISAAAEAEPTLASIWQSLARFIVPALWGWVLLGLLQAFATALDFRAETLHDEHAARSRRTRIAILSRTLGAIIIFVTVALMLLGIPGVRNVGVTLMASAGLAGLAVGAAAQPALKSLIAGLQMAITEPIRLGDLILIDGESGRVEDFRMSYVVVRTSDERRLIVPTAKFLDTTFQNWTRVSGGITGTVVLPVSCSTPIQPIREQFEAMLKKHRDWDKRTCELQVFEIRVDHIELRLVMSAHRPPELARLRLAIREGMVEWLRTEMPDALCKQG